MLPGKRASIWSGRQKCGLTPEPSSTQTVKKEATDGRDGFEFAQDALVVLGFPSEVTGQTKSFLREADVYCLEVAAIHPQSPRFTRQGK